MVIFHGYDPLGTPRAWWQAGRILLRMGRMLMRHAPKENGAVMAIKTSYNWLFQWVLLVLITNNWPRIGGKWVSTKRENFSEVLNVGDFLGIRNDPLANYQ